MFSFVSIEQREECEKMKWDMSGIRKMNEKTSGKWYSVLGVVVLKLFLELVYIKCIIVAPEWTDMKFGYAPDGWAFLLSYFYCICLVLLIPELPNRVSVLFCHFFCITSVVPTMVFYWTNGKEHIYPFFLFAMVSLVFVFANLKIRIPLNKLYRETKIYAYFMYTLFVFYCGCVLYLCIKGGGIDLRALSLIESVQIRNDASELSALDGYLLNWMAKAFTPFFMGYMLYKRKYILNLICMINQVLLYFTFGHKAYLLSIALFWLLFILTKLCRDAKVMYYLSFAAMCGVATLYGLGCKSKLVWLIAWQGVMRLLYAPATVKFMYYEYFSEREKLFFSEGIIGKILGLDYPYDKPIGFVITEHFWGPEVESNSNTGVLGDLYSQAGYLGMVLGGILLGFIILIMDMLSTNIPRAYKIAMVSFVCISLNDNPLQTTLLTGGWVIMIFLLMLFNLELDAERQNGGKSDGKENSVNECG